MKIFAALDVGDKATHLCVLDDEGTVMWRGVCATDPEASLSSSSTTRDRGQNPVVLDCQTMLPDTSLMTMLPSLCTASVAQ
jgi:transposase